MELLGEILHFSKSGRIIVKMDKYKPSIKPGLNVSDNQEKKIGKISEILGPIKSPYASIIPFIQKRNKLTGTKVYIHETLKKNYSSKAYNSKSRIKRNKK
ncbi:MAG: Gar1/Naf1 family protein [Thermoproteota archaeon]|nr:Gar1/Naf1 family protein [Thermoproteota archaeon]